MAGVQGLLKKHDTFEVDLQLHKQRVDDLIRQGKQVKLLLKMIFSIRNFKELNFQYFVNFQLIDSGNHHAARIKDRCDQLLKRLHDIEDMATRRLQKLRDNSAHLQFMWKCDVVESWIGKSQPWKTRVVGYRGDLLFWRIYLQSILFSREGATSEIWWLRSRPFISSNTSNETGGVRCRFECFWTRGNSKASSSFASKTVQFNLK